MSMSSSPQVPRPAGTGWGGWVLTALFLIPAAILFTLVYFALPANQHFGALITIGILSLIVSAGSYLAEALSREPTAQRSLAWGFFGMGFAVLFLSVLLGPTYGVLSVVAQLVDLMVLVIVLFVAVAFIVWRTRAVRATRARGVARAAWRNEPAPSAFDYSAASSPSVPQAAPAPGQSPPPRSP